MEFANRADESLPQTLNSCILNDQSCKLELSSSSLLWHADFNIIRQTFIWTYNNIYSGESYLMMINRLNNNSIPLVFYLLKQNI